MSDNQREAGTIVLDPTHASFSPQEGVNDLGATHFIGIGGAGMSVLAEMLHEQGVEVDGSDREPSAKTDRLQGIGITVEFGQRAENVERQTYRRILQRHQIRQSGNRRSIRSRRTHRAPQRHSRIADERKTCGDGRRSSWQNHDQFHAGPYPHPCR